MQNTLILFDDNWADLKPLTFTRPVSELRIGILTIKEKWEKRLGLLGTYHTAPYLAIKYPTVFGATNWLINGSVLPTKELCECIEKLPENTLLTQNGVSIALKTDKTTAEAFLFGGFAAPDTLETNLNFIKITYPWDIFMNNKIALDDDFQLVTAGRMSQPLSSTNTVIGDKSRVFLEEGAWVEASILNTQDGPIYIGKNAMVMEGSMIRGGFALCEGAGTKMGVKIYGATTVGPYCKVGGEINNSVLLGYSNKGHDGFLGNSVLGEWCNLGADTNNSNLKNNYADVRVWNYPKGSFIHTDLQFCGLIMGDHSKSAINTMFNTGTVVGVSCNVFGSDFPRKFIPSFSWGGNKNYTIYQLDNAIETAERVMQRRNKIMDEKEKAIFAAIFGDTAQYRKF